MSTDATPPPDPRAGAPQTDDATGGVARARKLQLSEDWIATVVGLALLALAIAGVITPELVP